MMKHRFVTQQEGVGQKPTPFIGYAKQEEVLIIVREVTLF
ncbi:MAG: hypothetical protein QOD99_311 [Chthoniobacter sp.]|jgi:hypothetical protein|nr:hypothetical protein [Chthoniobacter sp.]